MSIKYLFYELIATGSFIFFSRELAFVEATCFQQINRELDQVHEFFYLVFQLLKVYWNNMRDSCRNGLHAASCGTGNGRGGTAMSEEEHRRRMDELRRREEVRIFMFDYGL